MIQYPAHSKQWGLIFCKYHFDKFRGYGVSFNQWLEEQNVIIDDSYTIIFESEEDLLVFLLKI